MSAPDAGDTPCVFTIGHSNHPEEVLLGLLAEHRIEVVADVRSQPYSRYTPHFNGDQIRTALAAQAIRYVFLGQQLGGRPDEPEFYDEGGYVRYDRLAASPQFRAGIRRLQQGLAAYRVAVMCGEENPAECHRNLLIGRVLAEAGVEVVHIRGDGRLQSQAELDRESGAAGPRQTLLFDELEERSWKSTRSVLPKLPPASSSDA